MCAQSTDFQKYYIKYQFLRLIIVRLSLPGTKCVSINTGIQIFYSSAKRSILMIIVRITMNALPEKQKDCRRTAEIPQVFLSVQTWIASNADSRLMRYIRINSAFARIWGFQKSLT